MAETLCRKKLPQINRNAEEYIFSRRTRTWEWDIINDTLRLPAMNNLRPEIRLGDFLKLIDPRDKAHLVKRISIAVYEKKAFQAQMRILLPERAEKGLMVEGETLYDRLGKPIKMIGIFRKIAPGSDIENGADEAPPSYAGSWEWDAGRNEISWSDAVYRIYGMEPQSFVPEAASHVQFAHEEDKERVAGAWLGAVGCGRMFRVYFRAIRADGEMRDVLLQGRPVLSMDGKLQGMEGMLLDLTVKMGTEKLMSGALQVLKQVIDNAPIGIFWKDTNLRILGCNRMYARLEGATPEELTGKMNAEIHSKSRAEEYNNDDIYVITTGKPKLGYEEKIETPFGERILKTSKVPLLGENGEVMGVLGVTEDITDLKRSEEERHRLQDTEAIARRQKEQVTDFFTNISHEFKTPLSIILIQLELMSMYMDDGEKMAELIAAATQNTYRLTRLVGNLLDLTRIDSGYMGLNLAQTDITRVIRELCNSVEDFAQTKLIRLDFVSDCGEMRIQMDSDKLERIILNLLSNAIKHTPQGGSILVSLERKGERMSIRVKDTGEGIPQDKLESIFDRFTQVNNSLTNNEGTGIGLSLVKSLVGLLGGTIGVESKPGKGSTFTVELPAKEAEDQFQQILIDGYDLHRKTAMELSDI